jgi:predicted transcriptional regulator
MNNQQKKAIQQLREEGQSYARIAELLSISQNTVQSYCRRNNLTGVALPNSEPVDETFCRQCGAPLMQIIGKKKKQYCSDQCRMAWWNAHPEAVNHKSLREFTCQTCARAFEDYGKRERKFCSRACYCKSKAVQG